MSDPFSSLNRISAHLSYHVDRYKIISGNLANIDTPGYRAQELDFEEEMRTSFEQGKKKVDWEINTRTRVQDDEVPDQDGNSVSLEAQLSKKTANTIRYNVLSTVLRKKLGMLKYAATDGNR